VVAFHESISTFVAIEAMLDLKARYNKIDQIEQEKKRKVVI